MARYFPEREEPLHQLVGLAGLCHDLAKSHAEWQAYIVSDSIKKGPTHAACGAFFFSYFGYHLLQETDRWDDDCVCWLWLTRDIADHHSQLHNLTDDRWLKRYDWDMYDLPGIETFIHEQYDTLCDVPCTEESFEVWIDEAEDAIEEALDALDLGYDEWEALQLMEELQKWRDLTTSLIAGDRFDVRTVDTVWLAPKQHRQHQRYLEQFCRENGNHPLATVRVKAQADIMAQLAQRADARFYTLEMPTGYGKTVTALKMGAWFGEQQGYRKIVYVAPYLSILEQTSHVIEEVLREKALEHHSLAVLDDDDEQRAASSQLAMESWAHAIVCTSFQQFSKALFPRRSQDALRRAFLRDSVIIIDEPQIFNPEVWNLFLCGLEALASLVNLKVIFLSATMPPFHYGLSRRPAALTIEATAENDRYELIREEAKDEVSLTQFLLDRETRSQAAILNTIEDAYRVYHELKDALGWEGSEATEGVGIGHTFGNDEEDKHWGVACKDEGGVDGERNDERQLFLLHGLMTPLHKSIAIEKVRAALAHSDGPPLYVVSTQVIEAGVDVSFRHVARALPILPSIVQAAGRVNRHAEGGKKGTITVFPFLRHGKTNTRTFIYAKALRQITDELIEAKPRWSESELTQLVQQYYEEMFRQNTYETVLAHIRSAYEGRWEELADFQPFGPDYLKLPLFVPWDPTDTERQWLPNKFVALQQKFDVFSGHEVYDRFADQSYMAKLSFDERKQFMILFGYYVLNVPVKKALQVASREDFLQQRVPCLYGNDAYDAQVGLKAPFEEYDNFI